MRLALSLRWRFLNLDLRAVFYMVCNLTQQNKWEELTDEDIFGDPWLRRLCEEEHIAQVEGQGLNLVKDTWAKTCKEQEKV